MDTVLKVRIVMLQYYCELRLHSTKQHMGDDENKVIIARCLPAAGGMQFSCHEKYAEQQLSRVAKEYALVIQLGWSPS